MKRNELLSVSVAFQSYRPIRSSRKSKRCEWREITSNWWAPCCRKTALCAISPAPKWPPSCHVVCRRPPSTSSTRCWELTVARLCPSASMTSRYAAAPTTLTSCPKPFRDIAGCPRPIAMERSLTKTRLITTGIPSRGPSRWTTRTGDMQRQHIASINPSSSTTRHPPPVLLLGFLCSFDWKYVFSESEIYRQRLLNYSLTPALWIYASFPEINMSNVIHT